MIQAVFITFFFVLIGPSYADPLPGEANCTIGSNVYLHNTELTGTCVDELICKNGKFEGTPVPHPCCVKCQVKDDPHVIAVNNCHYDNMNQCRYTILQAGYNRGSATHLFSYFSECDGFKGRTCLKNFVFKDTHGMVLKFFPFMGGWKNRKVVFNNKGTTLAETGYTTFPSDGSKPYFFVWMTKNKGLDCLTVLGGHKGLLVEFCKVNHHEPALHKLTVFHALGVLHRYNGLCGNIQLGSITYRNLTKVACSKHPGWEFFEDWKAFKNDTCTKISRSETQEGDCPGKKRKDVERKCSEKLRKLPLSNEILDGQIDFCVEDICGMRSKGLSDPIVDGYIENIKGSIVQEYMPGPLRGAESCRDKRSYEVDCEHFAAKERDEDDTNAILRDQELSEDPALYNDDYYFE